MITDEQKFIMQYFVLLNSIKDNPNIPEYLELETESQKIFLAINELSEKISNTKYVIDDFDKIVNGAIGNFRDYPELEEILHNIDDNLILAVDKLFNMIAGKKGEEGFEELNMSMLEYTLELEEKIKELQKKNAKPIVERINTANHRIRLEEVCIADTLTLTINGVNYPSFHYNLEIEQEEIEKPIDEEDEIDEEEIEYKDVQYLTWLFDEENGGFNLDESDDVVVQYLRGDGEDGNSGSWTNVKISPNMGVRKILSI